LELLILTQVVLSFQLPFAIVPLVQFSSDPRQMGRFASGGWLKLMAWTTAAGVVALNAVLVVMKMIEWADALAEVGHNPWWIYGTIGPVALLLGTFLGWLTLYPRWARRAEAPAVAPGPALVPVRYGRIGVAVEFAPADEDVLDQAAALARSHQAELVIVHVVEGTGAQLFGAGTDDRESRDDRKRIGELVTHLREAGFRAQGVLGYGVPVEQLTSIAREQGFDLLVMGTHGHRFLADMALGQTVAPLLHRLTIPVLVVPTRSQTR
jgi:manganese transport protein